MDCNSSGDGSPIRQVTRCDVYWGSDFDPGLFSDFSIDSRLKRFIVWFQLSAREAPESLARLLDQKHLHDILVLTKHGPVYAWRHPARVVLDSVDYSRAEIFTCKRQRRRLVSIIRTRGLHTLRHEHGLVSTAVFVDETVSGSVQGHVRERENVLDPRIHDLRPRLIRLRVRDRGHEKGWVLDPEHKLACVIVQGIVFPTFPGRGPQEHKHSLMTSPNQIQETAMAFVEILYLETSDYDPDICRRGQTHMICISCHVNF